MSRLTAISSTTFSQGTARLPRQHPLPELSQTELFPQLASYPTSPELPRSPTTRLESSTSATSSGGAAVVTDCPCQSVKSRVWWTPAAFFDHFNRALPAVKLRGVQFPQM